MVEDVNMAQPEESIEGRLLKVEAQLEIYDFIFSCVLNSDSEYGDFFRGMWQEIGNNLQDTYSEIFNEFLKENE